MKQASSHRFSHVLKHTPNGITGIRIGIALAFPFCPEAYHLPLILAGLATEFLDGQVARMFQWTSYLGQVLDPIADKLFVLSVSLTWIVLDKISPLQWLLFALRDFGVLLIVVVLLVVGQLSTVRSVKARLPSKVTTALQYLLFLVILTGSPDLIWPLAWATAGLGMVATLQYAYLVRLSLTADTSQRLL